jgi:lysophospholipase L1-like esterase
MKMNLNRVALLLSFALLLGKPSVLAQTKIIPLGDSITKGAVDSAPGSGYRAQLFHDLKKAGSSFQFVGCTDANSNQELISARQQYHNGYGTYRIDDLLKNLDGVTQPGGWADDNKGGYWLTGSDATHREAVYPDIVLILDGTNDLGQGAGEPVMESRMTSLLEWFKNNRPQAQIFVGTVPPHGPNKDAGKYNAAVVQFNTWLATKVPDLGANFHLVDLYSLFVNASGDPKAPDSPDGIFLADGIHPSHQGYVAMGDAWFEAIKSLVPTGADPASTSSPAL